MSNKEYSANLTGAWFLFYEIKQVIKLMESGMDIPDIKRQIIEENLFQHKSKSSVTRVLPSVIRRAELLSKELRQIILEDNMENGRIVNLYAIMLDDMLFSDFMYEVIKEKYKSNKLYLEQRDINKYFSRKAEQSEKVASYQVSTIDKLKQVYLKILMEVGILSNLKSKDLNKIYIEDNLSNLIKKNNGEKFLDIFS